MGRNGDAAMSVEILAILITVVLNLLVVAFAGGRLWQKVSDNTRRLTRIEGILNGSNSRQPSSTRTPLKKKHH